MPAAEKVEKQIPRRPEGLLGMTNQRDLIGTTEVVPCYEPVAARLKSCPVTKRAQDDFFSSLRSRLRRGNKPPTRRPEELVSRPVSPLRGSNRRSLGRAEALGRDDKKRRSRGRRPEETVSRVVSPLRGSPFVPPTRGLTPAANTNVAAPRLEPQIPRSG